jgi:hypothetical protein
MRLIPQTIALSAALTAAASAQVRITEFMYAGGDGEFIELTNVTPVPVDMTGWSFDDRSGVPGTFDLSAAGVLSPGESLIITESSAADFEASWGLTGVTILGDSTVAKLGREDIISVYDANDNRRDALHYGDTLFQGSLRPREVSAQICTEGLGSYDIYRWTAATVGDAWSSRMSTNGDVGSPGVYTPVACLPISTVYCTSAPNSTGAVAHLTAEGSPSALVNGVTLSGEAFPTNSVGLVVISYYADVVLNPGGSVGTLCLGGSIGRYSNSLQHTGSTGTFTMSVDLQNMPMSGGTVSTSQGDSWRFQCWFRDSNMGVPVSNFSDAILVPFL